MIFSLAFTAVIFAVYRTPAVLYLGLLYSMMVAFSRGGLVERTLRLDAQALVGVLLVGISPVFLIVRFGEYPSPATFHALVLIGVSLLLFEVKSTALPNSIALFEMSLAAAVRMEIVERMIARTSDIFVGATSHLVRWMVDLSGIPIKVQGNTAVVRNSIIVIGSGCSGLDAFVLYLLASTLLILLRKSGREEAALLLLGAVGIIPLNALRIFTLLVVGYHSGIPFLELFHSHLGDLPHRHVAAEERNLGNMNVRIVVNVPILDIVPCVARDVRHGVEHVTSSKLPGFVISLINPHHSERNPYEAIPQRSELILLDPYLNCIVSGRGGEFISGS
ncbi:archaeosortase/exosortase family protein [Thermococcus celer]|uniref:Uncharacterized protein n=1 Tax=Thermococcus celer Vu 13 = JCM 8558 TaxID=1293037 RepID=A0A218P0I0_THECE|nr:archaeosortase/exosortase family protein [Thermococcus celer]ASI98399.1 hypothetical protein A3L02_01880 [Thermococcus celer Vu 13 = JCM 8558]